MNKDLAGTLFVYEGIKFDYCYKEALQCLLNFCDKVFVIAGGEDETYEIIQKEYAGKVWLNYISKEAWNEQKGKEKLNYFTNIPIQRSEEAGYKYQFNLQADEIVHEKSYEAIRKAVAANQDAFMCTRVNLWGSPYTELNVTNDRMPCSPQVIRLAKTQYLSCGDAESVDAPANFDFVNDIRVYHMGFVRDRKIMKSKVINMQEAVFGINHDPKLDGIDYFEPERWFSKDELKYINEPLPLLIQDWAKERNNKSPG